MGKNIVSLNNGFEDVASFINFTRNVKNKSEKLIRMEKILKTAIKTELTERQKKCIEMYFFGRMPVSEIADELCIRPTTVYKHISKAKKAIKRSFVYL